MQKNLHSSTQKCRRLFQEVRHQTRRRGIRGEGGGVVGGGKWHQPRSRRQFKESPVTGESRVVQLSLSMPSLKMKQEKTKHFSSETIRSFVLWSADEFEGCLKPILFLSTLSSPATFKTKSKKRNKNKTTTTERHERSIKSTRPRSPSSCLWLKHFPIWLSRNIMKKRKKKDSETN